MPFKHIALKLCGELGPAYTKLGIEVGHDQSTTHHL